MLKKTSLGQKTGFPNFYSVNINIHLNATDLTTMANYKGQILLQKMMCVAAQKATPKGKHIGKLM